MNLEFFFVYVHLKMLDWKPAIQELVQE